jgi:hypothetical protein
MDGYIELKPDWKGSREAITAAADGAGGVGVDGDPTGSEPLPAMEGVRPPPLLAGVTFPPLDIACEWSVVMFALDGVPLCEPPLSCDERTVLPPLPPPPPPPTLLLPGSRFWFRSFSSRRHLARRLENQT